MTDVQPTDHSPILLKNQHSDHFDDEDDEDDRFDLHFSFDDLFADEQGSIGDAFASDRKYDGVFVEVSDCSPAVNYTSSDRSLESLIGDCSITSGDVPRATSSEGSANGASGSGVTEVSDLKIKVEAKSTSKRKNESAEEDENRKKARLIRNRESAQMSRERKKHYVKELEGKIRAMQTTITDLNCKFAYLMAENASLRQRIGGGVIRPPVAQPCSSMVPLGYSWMPSLHCAMNVSQAHMLPIISVKPRKTEVKTKSVASFSLIGLLVFLFLLGGLVPMVNIKYGGIATSQQQDRVFTVNVGASGHGSRIKMESDVSKEMYMYDDDDDDGYRNNVKGKQEAIAEPGKSAKEGSLNQALVASLYVPRNDQLVKIDGSLTIHSVLASENTMTSQEAISMTVAQNLLADSVKASADDPRQWYREGTAGPKLSSASCTEVFQLDGSSESNSGAIVPSSLAKNISADHQSNSTILSETTHKTNPQSLRKKAKMKEEHIDSNKSTMVVSVHIDPKEAMDRPGSDDIMSSKAFPRVFVVVLLERVRYVTYSCALPVVKGSITNPART